MDNLVPSVEEIRSLELMANTASETSFFGTMKPAEIMVLFYAARDLGLPRSVVLMKGLNLIQGSIELSARVMNMLIRRDGHQIKLALSTDKKCILWGKRKDTGEEMEVEYSIEDARQAGLIRQAGGWTKYPQDMLFARAISRLARRLFPDCVGNCYIEGEIGDKKSKEPPEAPDLTSLDIEPMQEVELEPPEGVPKERVEEYIRALMNHFHIPTYKIKEQAAGNIDQFWETFHAWNKKKEEVPVSLEEKEEEEMSMQA